MPRTRSVVSPRRSPRQRLARQLGAEADVARGLALAPALEELEHRAGELEAENTDSGRRSAASKPTAVSWPTPWRRLGR